MQDFLANSKDIIGELTVDPKINPEEARSVQDLSTRLLSEDAKLTDQEFEILREAIMHHELKLLVPHEIKSHRKYTGFIIVTIKKIIFRLMGFILKDTFRHQSVFNAKMIELYAKSKR